MRLALVLTLGAKAWCADPADFRNEDLRAVRQIFQQTDPSLDWFQILDKKPIGAGDSILLVEAAPTELRPGARERSPVYQRERIGLFAVAGPANTVRLVLDTFALNSVPGRPELDQAAGAVYLHFHAEYGFYRGSIKYFFDLAGSRPTRKFRYGVLALTAVTRENGQLRYQASFGQGAELSSGWTPRSAIVTITPLGGDSLPSYQIVDTPPQPAPAAASDSSLRVAGEPVVIVHATVPGQPDRIAGISAGGMFFPVPVPTPAQYRVLRPADQPPTEIHNDIGPFAANGATLWFANTFYDGEGDSGLGAIGSFDVTTRSYQMRYLPEIAGWSGSAMLVNGRDLWVGLMRRPEGANFGGGLLRYDIDTGAVKKYAIPDLIYTLDRLNDTLYCGTSNGLYTIRGERVTQLRFEPDAQGNLTMVARAIR